MYVVEQVQILNHAANTALSLVPLWAVLYIGLHILRGNKPQPAPIVTPGPLVESLRASRVIPAPKPELIPEPHVAPRKRTRKSKAQP